MAVITRMAAGLALALLPALAWSATVRQKECLDTSTSMSLFPSWLQTAQGGTAQGHSTNFTIVYHDTYKTIYNYAPNETYVLYQCGTTPPSSTDPDVPAGAKVFQVPVQQVMVTDTTAVALLRAIGVLDRVAYTSANSVNSCMQKLLAATCTNTPSRTAAYVDAEDNTFLSQLATVDAEFGWDTSKLAKTVAIRAPSEPTPLRRMEWVKMIAAFFNKESTANDYYNQVSASYTAVKAAAATAGKARSATPKVAWLYFSPGYTYNGQTYPDKWQLSWAPYKNFFIQDAGGDVLDFAATVAAVVDGVSIISSGTEIYFDKPAAAAALHQVLASVDFVVDSSAYPGISTANTTFQAFLDMYGYNASQVNSTKFLAAGNIIRLDGVVSADGVNWAWFEDAVARPDQVLRDLVNLITPGAWASISATAPVYAKAIGAPNRVVPVLPSACTSTLSASTCTFAYDPICPTVHKACNGSLVYATAAEPCTPTSCPPPSSQSPSPVTASPPPPGGAAGTYSRLSMLTALLALAAVLLAMMT